MASPVDTSVKFFTDAMVGATVLNNSAGSLIDVLDACLVNGFGSKSVVSLVVASGIATLTFSGGASAAVPQSVILVAGVTGGMTGLNGEQKVLSANSTTVTFATALADGTASGTITFKMAPLGWSKVFSGTNKAVYKPSDVSASSALLRVDDSGTASARVRMFESMSDIDTGTNPAPPDSRISGGQYWWKSDNSNSAARKYTVVGDSRNFYFAPVLYEASGSAVVQAFGDLDAFKSGDAYCGCLIGNNSDSGTNPTGNAPTPSTTTGVTQLVRSHTGIGASINAERKPLVGDPTGAGSGADTFLGPFPSAANNGLFLTRMVVGASPISTNTPRGLLPGLLYVPQSGTNNGQLPRGTLVDGADEFSGKKLYAVSQAGANMHLLTNDYVVFFDVTGPWRE